MSSSLSLRLWWRVEEEGQCPSGNGFPSQSPERSSCLPCPLWERLPAMASVVLPYVTALVCMFNKRFGVKTDVDVSQAET